MKYHSSLKGTFKSTYVNLKIRPKALAIAIFGSHNLQDGINL
jgi:hypothetical protein